MAKPKNSRKKGKSEPREEREEILVKGDVEVLPPELPDDDEDAAQLPEVVPAEQGEVSERGIVSYNALQAYLSEIRKFSPLSKDEEHRLAVSYYENKERDAAYKLISSNLWLVVKIAREYEKAARSLLDLIQEGNIGLMEAVSNFDPYRGVRFPSYAVWWIRAYIIRFVIANWRMVKIGTTQAQRKLFFNLKKEKERLEREGFYPAPQLLAEKLNVKEHEVLEMEQRLSLPDLSVDAPVSEDGEANFLNLTPSGALNAEELVAKKQMRRLLDAALADFRKTLNDKESLIFDGRLLSEEKATLQEIADNLSLSKERIRQLEERIKQRLKIYLSEKLGSFDESIDFFR